MGVGGALAVTETLGFTQLRADRGVGVDVASDDTAAIQLLGNDSPLSTFDSVSDTFTVTLSNTSNTALTSNSTVTVEVTNDDITTNESVSIDVNPSDDFSESESTANGSSFSKTFGLDGTLDVDDEATIKLSDDDNSSNSGNSLTFKFKFNLEFNGTELTTERTGITYTT